MKKYYDGLDVFKICLDTNVTTGSGSCQAMIQLRMENGICVSPDYQQQIEYVGNNG